MLFPNDGGVVVFKVVNDAPPLLDTHTIIVPVPVPLVYCVQWREALVTPVKLIFCDWRDDEQNLADTSVTLSINGSTSTTVTASPATDPDDIVWTGQVLSGTAPNYVDDGFYYACKKDVTALVQEYSDGGTSTVNGYGDGTYQVGGLYGDTKSVQYPGYLADSGYAGWSLVIIYSDASTLGHQLYLFDLTKSIPSTSGANLIPISGFVVPSPISGESTSADAVKMTVFVGEGDKNIQGDRVSLRGQSNPTIDNWLWDGVTDDTNDNLLNPPTSLNDNFNSEFRDPSDWDYNTPTYPYQWSPTSVHNIYGIDVDTYHIPWSSNIVQPGNTSATINIYTNGDGLVSIYVIASFRSSITSGGSISYLIKRRAPSP